MAAPTDSDSLSQLADAVDQEEKLTKVMDHEVLRNDPDEATLYARGHYNLGYGAGLSLIHGPMVSVDWFALPALQVQGNLSYLFSLSFLETSIQPYQLQTGDYSWDSEDLPLAEPEERLGYMDWNLGVVWNFKTDRKEIIQPQVFRQDHLGTVSGYNSTTHIIGVKYVDVPVEVRRSYGLRAGAHYTQSKNIAEETGGWTGTNSDGQQIFVGYEKGYAHRGTTHTDSTNGWTYMNAMAAYVGFAYTSRQNSLIKLTQRKTGAEYEVEKNSTWQTYIDFLYTLMADATPVRYYDVEYTVDAKKPTWGIRLGLLASGASGALVTSYGFDMSYYNETFAVKANFGLGTWR
jgi:hypothetical protein